MTHDKASINIAGHALEVPLDQFLQILNGSEPIDCETQFKRDHLRRRAIIAMRRAHPARFREFRLQGGQYWFGAGATHCEHWQCRTLADVLVAAMRWLHDHHPDALDRISRQRKHSRAYIATDPVSLYGGRSDLADYARQFVPGWYVDTNLSAENTQRFLNDAFRHASLVPGRDWYFSRLD